MAGVFISDWRQDGAGWADRRHDRSVARPSADRVGKDIDLDPGSRVGS